MEEKDGGGGVIGRANGKEDLTILTTEELEDRLGQESNDRNFRLVMEIAEILDQRENPQPGPSVPKIPRLDSPSAAPAQPLALVDGGGVWPPAIQSIIDAEGYTPYFKWYERPSPVVTPPVRESGCPCHGWPSPAPTSRGGIILTAIKLAIGWTDEADGCGSQLKTSEKYQNWKNVNNNDAWKGFGKRKDCLNICWIDGRITTGYFSAGRLRIRTDDRHNPFQLCSWIDCWEVKQRNCAEHQTNMWSTSAIGFYSPDNILAVVYPRSHTMNPGSNISTTWVNPDNIFTRILEEKNITIQEFETLEHFDERINGHYNNVLRHTLKLGINFLSFVHNVTREDDEEYVTVPTDWQQVDNANLPQLHRFLTANGMYMEFGEEMDKVKQPPFSKPTSTNVPLPHVYLKPMAPSILYAGINKSLAEAQKNLDEGKNTASMTHFPRHRSRVFKDRVGINPEEFSSCRNAIIIWRPTPTPAQIKALRNITSNEDPVWKDLVLQTEKKESILHKVLFCLEIFGATTADGFPVKTFNQACVIVDKYEKEDGDFFKKCARYITKRRVKIVVRVPLAEDEEHDEGKKWPEKLDWTAIHEIENQDEIHY